MSEEEEGATRSGHPTSSEKGLVYPFDGEKKLKTRIKKKGHGRTHPRPIGLLDLHFNCPGIGMEDDIFF